MLPTASALMILQLLIALKDSIALLEVLMEPLLAQRATFVLQEPTRNFLAHPVTLVTELETLTRQRLTALPVLTVLVAQQHLLCLRARLVITA